MCPALSKQRPDGVDAKGCHYAKGRLRVQETGIACGDTEVTLTGTTYGDRDIGGTDSIKTVGGGKK